MTEIKIVMHPNISKREYVSFKNIDANMIEKTLSRDIMTEATVGSRCFWVYIWIVNPIPLDIIPQYKIGNKPEIIFEIVGVSKINIKGIKTIHANANTLNVVI